VSIFDNQGKRIRGEMNNMSYSKSKCAGRITVFLVICLVGAILVGAPFMGLFLNSDGNATAPQLMPDLMAMACSTFLLVALAVDNKIEKLDLWTLGRSGLHMKIFFLKSADNFSSVRFSPCL